MTKSVTWVEAHPKEDLLAIGRTDEVILWGLQNGVAVRRLPHDGWVTNVRWSPDGELLIAAEESGRLTLYDRGGERRGTVETGHGKLYSTAFHPSGAFFATGGAVGKALVWTVGETFTEAYRIPAAKSPEVSAVGFKDDMLLLGFVDGYFEAWINGGSECPAAGELFGSGPVSGIGINPKFQVAVFGGGRGKMAALRTAPPWDCVETWPVPPKPIAVNQIAFSPDTERFVAACSDDAARVFTWSAVDKYGSELGKPFHERRPKPKWSERMIVSSACFDRTGSRVYTAHFSGMVKVWDLSQPYAEEVASLTFE